MTYIPVFVFIVAPSRTVDSQITLRGGSATLVGGWDCAGRLPTFGSHTRRARDIPL